MQVQVSFAVSQMRLLGLTDMANVEERAELTPDVDRMSTSCLVYNDGAPAPNTHPVNHKRHHYEPSSNRMTGTDAVLGSAVLGVLGS